MIVSFRSKALAELWSSGHSAKIDSRKQKRVLRLLDALDAADRPEDLNLPGFGFHGLHGFDPPRYAVSVNGPWRITFELTAGEARAVDFEQYH